MIQNILLPGGGLDFGEDITLSRGSVQRVHMAAELYYTHYLDHGADQTIYCTGAYPTLPEGMVPPALESREVSLMADTLINDFQIPAKSIEVDADSTSTAQSVLSVASRIAAQQEVRIEDILTEGSELGVVSREGHIRRISGLLGKLGCDTKYLRPVPIQEEGGQLFDLISLTMFRASVFGVEKGDIQTLIERDKQLEKVNDQLRTTARAVKKVVRKL